MECSVSQFLWYAIMNKELFIINDKLKVFWKVSDIINKIKTVNIQNGLPKR